MTILFGYHLAIDEVVHYFHVSLQRWYMEQWDPSTTGIAPSQDSIYDIIQWIWNNIVYTWILEMTSVTVFQGLRWAWDAWNNCNRHAPPAPYVQPPNNQANNQERGPPNTPRQNMNNQNRGR